MNLTEEAKSIEKYAEDIHLRIEKYEQEEDLRLRIIQKSLDQPSTTSTRHLSDSLVSFEEWSHRKHINNVYPSSSPSLSSKNRKSMQTSSLHEGNGKNKNSKLEGLTVDVSREGEGAPSTPSSSSSSRLKKTDSFKKKLRESYFIHQKHSPKNHMRIQQQSSYEKGGENRSISTPRSLQQVLIMGGSESSGGEDSPGRFGKGKRTKRQQGLIPEDPDIEGHQRRRSPQQSQQSQQHRRFDFNRIFSDGILFSSLDDDSNGNVHYHPSAVGRTASEMDDDMLEQGISSKNKSSADRGSFGQMGRQDSGRRNRRKSRDLEDATIGDETTTETTSEGGNTCILS
jgi:hypothetical protein